MVGIDTTVRVGLKNGGGTQMSLNELISVQSARWLMLAEL